MVTTPADTNLDAASRLAEIARAARSDPARATVLAVRARADGLSDPLMHHLVGMNLKADGRFEEAIAELGLGLALDPGDAGLMTTVGFCLMELDRRQEAAQVFGAAVKQDPRSAEASYGYGWAAERIGALDSAESGFRRALALDPNHADALAGLSGLAVRQRDWDVARHYAERAAQLDPRQTDALTNLARIDIGMGLFDAAASRLDDLIASPILKPLARANARIMLGDALDGSGRYDDAFAAYAEGKSEVRDLHAHQFEAPGAATIVDGVRRILAEYQATPLADWSSPTRGFQHGERGHAFLLGFPRSGTTLLEQVLATHPDVVTLEERPVMLDAELEFLTTEGGVTRLAGVVSDLLEPFRDDYWKKVGEFGVDAAGKVFIDKHPLSTFRLPLIAKLFPSAKIIFAMRDPRDVVLSCFRRSFKMNPPMYQFNTLKGAARFYDAVMTAGKVYLEQLPINVHRLRHEDLVADFEGQSRALCAFLEVEWTADLKDFAATANARRIATPSSTQVGRGLYSEGVGHWRHYAAHLEPILPILQPWIEAFGYADA